MNLDDESLLSAYLDDELDPADRLALEWTIETNPPLADQVRSIAQARAAVSGLSRPGIPRDLAADFAARLLANRRRELLRKLARPAQVAFAFTGFSAIAASLIFALILLNHSLHENAQPGPVALQPSSVADPRPHSEAKQLIEPPVAHSRALVETALPVKISPVAWKGDSSPSHASDEIRDRDARRVIAGMLEQPHVRRIRIVTDVLDASEKVKTLIHQDGRLNPEFGRISICQEIVIDPEFSEAVEVFAVPMDERDRKAFVGQLTKAFPGLVQEAGETSPEVVTQLTEVGQVALFRGTEAAPLVDPPHDFRPLIANRPTEIPEIHVVETEPDAAGANTASRPEPPKGQVEGPAASPTAKSRTELKPGDRVTVLVWVVNRSLRRL